MARWGWKTARSGSSSRARPTAPTAPCPIPRGTIHGQTKKEPAERRDAVEGARPNLEERLGRFPDEGPPSHSTIYPTYHSQLGRRTYRRLWRDASGAAAGGTSTALARKAIRQWS